MMINLNSLSIVLAILLPNFPTTVSQPLNPSPTTNLSTFNVSSELQCINSPEWATSGFLAGDCYTAIEKFRDREVEKYGATTLEFLAAGMTPIFPSLFWQSTPRRYKYKSCTMAILMLKDLPGDVVPVSMQSINHSQDICPFFTHTRPTLLDALMRLFLKF